MYRFRAAYPTSTDTATLVFTGDTIVHGYVWSAARTGAGEYDFRPLFDDVRSLISNADLAICHLEVPLDPTSSRLSGYPLFSSPAEVADGLAHAGFDGCSTA